MQFASSGLKALEDSYRGDGTLRHPKSEFFRELLNHIQNAVESTPILALLSTFLHRFQNPAKLLHSACVKRVTRERGNQVK